MNVGLAKAIFSYETVHGLRQLVKNGKYSRNFLTTAKFCEVVGRWFDLVTSRSPTFALSKHNMVAYN